MEIIPKQKQRKVGAGNPEGDGRRQQMTAYTSWNQFTRLGNLSVFLKSSLHQGCKAIQPLQDGISPETVLRPSTVHLASFKRLILFQSLKDSLLAASNEFFFKKKKKDMGHIQDITTS